MTRSQVNNRQRIFLILFLAFIFCTPVYALTGDTEQQTPVTVPEIFMTGEDTMLLAQENTLPDEAHDGNAYAYGHDKDRTTVSPEQTPVITETPTPVPTTEVTSVPSTVATTITETPKGTLTTPITKTTTPVTTQTLPVTVAPTPVGTVANTEMPRPAEPVKTVPLSGVIPDEALPAAAAGSAIALTGIFALFQSSISSWGSQIMSILKNAFGGIITGKILDRDKDRRSIITEETEKLYLGFAKKEILVLIAGTLLIGILFLFADRQPFEPTMIAIYIVMGGLCLVIHELAHLYFERKNDCRTEIQFWGIGTVIMALTAWLFGNVFAQPFMTLVRSTKPLEKNTLGQLMLSGPAVSMLLAILCLSMVPLGGLFRTAGTIGFIMNMVTAVFELLPIPPCEGKEVFTWNKLVWAGAFIPLFIIYLFMTM